MEIILLLIYSFFVWLIFFKFKWLPWNFISQIIVFTLPIFGITALILYLNVVAWLALIIVPVVLIAVFWIVHILPEQIAEKRKHPQLEAIKTLCLLSLVFGGMLWPLAWLWAYTRPVIHKMAYGTDKVPHGGADDALHPLEDAGVDTVSKES